MMRCRIGQSREDLCYDLRMIRFGVEYEQLFQGLNIEGCRFYQALDRGFSIGIWCVIEQRGFCLFLLIALVFCYLRYRVVDCGTGRILIVCNLDNHGLFESII